MVRFALLVIFTFLTFSTLLAQNLRPFAISLFSNRNVYKTKGDLKLTRVYDINEGEVVDDDVVYVLKLSGEYAYMRYTLLKEGDDGIFIRILPIVEFRKNPDNTVDIIADATGRPKTAAPIDNENPNLFYFKINDGDDEKLTPNQKYLATERIVGMPITLPVKFRKEDGNIRGEFEFSIGYAFGYRIRTNNNPYKDNYINIIPYGFSFNADQYISSTETDGVDSFSLTYWSSGVTYEFHGINFGAFIGRDKMFNDRSDWTFQNKTWMTFGLGYKFGGDD